MVYYVAVVAIVWCIPTQSSPYGNSPQIIVRILLLYGHIFLKNNKIQS